MQQHDGQNPPARPRAICLALLAALEASEGRRRRRKRDQTPDAIGLAIKRRLLEQAVDQDPEPDAFEAWLLRAAVTIGEDAQAPGAVAAMARIVFEEWRMAQSVDDFRDWLTQGAPSEDAFETPGQAAREEDRPRRASAPRG